MLHLIGFICAKRKQRKAKKANTSTTTQVEPDNENQDTCRVNNSSIPVNNSDNTVFEQYLESVGHDNVETSFQVGSDYNEDSPTYEEALQMEKTSPNEIRRRVSSRKSLKSEDLPDYDFVDCPVYSEEC